MKVWANLGLDRSGVTTRRVATLLIVIVLMKTSALPGQNAAPASGPRTTSGSDVVLTIKVSTLPDPPQSGDNTIEAIVTRQDGRPVTDATVLALLQMPPMPSMNMPEMSTRLTLLNQGGGLYRGKGQLVMSGTWNVTVTVSLGGTEVGRQRLTIIAK